MTHSSPPKFAAAHFGRGILLVKMNLSKEDLDAYLAKHPELILDTKTWHIRKRTAMDPPFHGSSTKSKKNKYRNVKLYEHKNGVVLEQANACAHGPVIAIYDSIKEYQRWIALKNLQKIGKVFNLERQVPMVIAESFVYHKQKINAIKYIADFMYTRENGDVIVEDVKPFDENTQKYRTTSDFKLKWKLLKAKYPDYYFELY